jgi:DNA-binding MarR family transcriptional regulator
VLLEKKLVRQLEDGQDRRRKLLELTAEGARIVAELEAQRILAGRHFLSAFSTAEKTAFLELLQRSTQLFNAP